MDKNQICVQVIIFFINNKDVYKWLGSENNETVDYFVKIVCLHIIKII